MPFKTITLWYNRCQLDSAALFTPLTQQAEKTLQGKSISMSEQSGLTILKITRSKAYIAMMIPHKIFVDDQEIGKVRNGKTQTVEVSPGKHVIYVKQSIFVRTNSVPLDCLPDQTIHLQVTQNNSFLQVFLALTGIGRLFLTRRANLNLERLP